MFINILSKILCSDFHLMSAFEKTRYIFDQSIWECNGRFDHCFSNTKSFLCSVWNLRKNKLYPEDFSMNTASNSSIERRVVNGSNAIIMIDRKRGDTAADASSSQSKRLGYDRMFIFILVINILLLLIFYRNLYRFILVA